MSPGGFGEVSDVFINVLLFFPHICTLIRPFTSDIGKKFNPNKKVFGSRMGCVTYTELLEGFGGVLGVFNQFSQFFTTYRPLAPP